MNDQDELRPIESAIPVSVCDDTVDFPPGVYWFSILLIYIQQECENQFSESITECLLGFRYCHSYTVLIKVDSIKDELNHLKYLLKYNQNSLKVFLEDRIQGISASEVLCDWHEALENLLKFEKDIYIKREIPESIQRAYAKNAELTIDNLDTLMENLS